MPKLHESRNFRNIVTFQKYSYLLKCFLLNHVFEVKTFFSNDWVDRHYATKELFTANTDNRFIKRKILNVDNSKIATHISQNICHGKLLIFE